MKRNPLWDAQAKQHLASGNAGAMLPNALAHQALPGASYENLARQAAEMYPTAAKVGGVMGGAAGALLGRGGNVAAGRAGLQQVMDQRRRQQQEAAMQPPPGDRPPQPMVEEPGPQQPVMMDQPGMPGGAPLPPKDFGQVKQLPPGYNFDPGAQGPVSVKQPVPMGPQQGVPMAGQQPDPRDPRLRQMMLRKQQQQQMANPGTSFAYRVQRGGV